MAQVIKIDDFTEDDQQVIITSNSDNLETSAADIHEEKVLELQLTMATSSINHEYARIEFDEVIDYERRGELLGYMADCRNNYLAARTELADYNPHTLETFERDLIIQKMTTITNYHA